MKKMVLKLDLHDGKDKQKAMKAVSTLLGIDSIAIDMKDRKMTVVGAADPVGLVIKLRKNWQTDIISIGPAQEEKKEEKKEEPKKEKKKEEKKEEPKKEEGKKEEANKEEPKKEEKAGKEEESKKTEPKAEEGEKKVDPHERMIQELLNAYKAQSYNPHMTRSYYYVQSAEENPNSSALFAKCLSFKWVEVEERER